MSAADGVAVPIPLAMGVVIALGGNDRPDEQSACKETRRVIAVMMMVVVAAMMLTVVMATVVMATMRKTGVGLHPDKCRGRGNHSKISKVHRLYSPPSSNISMLFQYSNAFPQSMVSTLRAAPYPRETA